MLCEDYLLAIDRYKHILERKIIHADMDAFYASIEQRDNTSLKNKPVIVGYLPEERGVVCAASYEARRYGIKSAMSTFKALKLCPNAILIRPDFEKYEKVSAEFIDILKKYSDLIEPLSLDEAYIDITENKLNIKSGTKIGWMIKNDVKKELKLTVSIGLSNSKFVSKIASDLKKPDGFTIVKPENVINFICNLPIGKFYGIGKKTETYLNSIGIYYGKDLFNKSLKELIDIFGKNGLFYYKILRGIDEREIISNYKRKSLGIERTFLKDTSSLIDLYNFLSNISENLSKQLKENHIKIKTITLKVKYEDFKTVSRNKTLTEYIDDYKRIYETSIDLLKNVLNNNKKIRLLGLSVSNFLERTSYYQPELPFTYE